MFKVTRKDLEDVINRCNMFNIEPNIDEFEYERVVRDGKETYRLLKWLGSDIKLDLGDTFDEIQIHAFNDTKVEEVNLGNLEQLSTMVFHNAPFLRKVIANSVKEIDRECFKNCVRLEEIELKSVKRIETSAFAHCTSLKKVIGTSQLQVIGDEAFKNCLQLQQIDLSSVKDIGQKAFVYCINLQEVSIPLVTLLRKRVFSHCINLHTLYAPKLINFSPCSLSCCYSIRTLWVNELKWFCTYLGTYECMGIPNKVYVCDNTDEERLKNIFKGTKCESTNIVFCISNK